MKKICTIKQCLFCHRTDVFTGVYVEHKGWYIVCDYKRSGCGAGSGWYDELGEMPEGFEIVTEMDYGHPYEGKDKKK